VSLLACPPPPRADATSLDKPCNCPGQMLLSPPLRSQCIPCIESWVRAVGRDAALDEAEVRSPICGDRIAQIANRIHYERRLGPED